MRDRDAERSYWMQVATECQRMLDTGKLSQDATDDYRRALEAARQALADLD